MSVDANRKLVQGYFAVLNDGLVDTIDRDFFTVDFQLHLNSRPVTNRTMSVNMLKAFVYALPGLFHAIEDQIVEGDKVVTRVTISGTHQRPLGKLQPTGKEVSFSAIYIHRIAGDRIAEQWVFWDQPVLLSHLGVSQEPAS